MEPSRTRRTGRLTRLIRLALDPGIVSLACYGCVLAGLDTLPALPAASEVAAVWVGATALHDRRGDAPAVAVLLMQGLSAASAALTAEPRVLLRRDPLVSGLAVLVFLKPDARHTGHRPPGRPAARAPIR
ncbi:hypothetical protein [Streptomyces sp. NPDC059224]|uniref:hypothetical protein n=1 Tax=Streptomyces sp. NPDC059224 TaxID=3346775 RepID=UPI0036A03C3B